MAGCLLPPVSFTSMLFKSVLRNCSFFVESIFNISSFLKIRRAEWSTLGILATQLSTRGIVILNSRLINVLPLIGFSYKALSAPSTCIFDTGVIVVAIMCFIFDVDALFLSTSTTLVLQYTYLPSAKRLQPGPKLHSILTCNIKPLLLTPFYNDKSVLGSSLRAAPPCQLCKEATQKIRWKTDREVYQRNLHNIPQHYLLFLHINSTTKVVAVSLLVRLLSFAMYSFFFTRFVLFVNPVFTFSCPIHDVIPS